ncbi:hypothetical protein BGZ65_011853, partial [Modicella reniformis]
GPIRELPPREEVEANMIRLNADQRVAYQRIETRFEAVVNGDSSEKEPHAFIDEPIGTGKTFLYSLLLARARSSGHIALAVAFVKNRYVAHEGKTNSTFK